MSQFAARFAIPAGVAIMAAQSSLVSVYGGQRAIIFDRFQGVKEQVGCARGFPGTRTVQTGV